ncbi:MAG: ZIP family metal transporter [Succinivibrio sp.]|nr:ZIP family metal transporter [Succinivibrio sp.]
MFTFSLTCVGSAFVFPLKKEGKKIYTKMALGFAAGIMLSAAVFSLLLPALELAEKNGQIPQFPAVGGLILGAAFLIMLDKSLPHLHMWEKKPEGPRIELNRNVLLFIAITIHNIPEGIAVGVSAASAALTGNDSMMTEAMILSLGIGIQNIPEGTAVALPFFSSGMSKFKAFALGSLSGIAEPLAAMIIVSFVGVTVTMLPWFLSFAAGAMLYVVVEELIPEVHQDGHSDLGTLSVLSGFILMMFLDTALG